MGFLRTPRLPMIGVVAAMLLAFAPGAVGRETATLPLNVQFTATGSITVTLADGTPVGTTSGTPTLIPAGYYTVWLTGPGGCTAVPHFMLNGPGESIFDNLTEGETDNVSYNAFFTPNSTYTWKSDAAPTVVHTFTTGPVIMGTPPSTGPIESSKHTIGSSTSLVGSAVVPFRGKLAADVTAAGKLTLAFKGKGATSLMAGRYTVTVVDQSAKSGFTLQKAKRTKSLTGVKFVGKRTASVTLTAGTWSFGNTSLLVH